MSFRRHTFHAMRTTRLLYDNITRRRVRIASPSLPDELSHTATSADGAASAWRRRFTTTTVICRRVAALVISHVSPSITMPSIMLSRNTQSRVYLLQRHRLRAAAHAKAFSPLLIFRRQPYFAHFSLMREFQNLAPPRPTIPPGSILSAK